MLSTFPLQFLAPLAYLLLRLCLGLCLLYLGSRHLRHRHELKHILKLSWWPFGTTTTYIFAFGEMILAGLLLAGLYTQLAALLTAAMSLKLIILRPYFDHYTIPSRFSYILILAISVTLIITGAGAFSVDLPI